MPRITRLLLFSEMLAVHKENPNKASLEIRDELFFIGAVSFRFARNLCG